MASREVRLVPLGGVSPELLDRLADGLRRHLPVQPVLVEEPMAATSPLPASAALDALLARVRPGGWCLGVTAAPLRGEAGEEVFGQATVGGPVAVVSAHPFADAHGLVATAVHELGHAAGLEHCAAAACAMYPSRSARETDGKGPGLCGACAGALRRILARGA